MESILVGIGGAFGAVLRYLVGRLVASSEFPWATLVVNALGSLVLGVVIFGLSNGHLFVLVGVGFCGAFTTFSTFSFQTVGLWEREEQRLAIINAIANFLISAIAFLSAWLAIG